MLYNLKSLFEGNEAIVEVVAEGVKYHAHECGYAIGADGKA